MEDFIEAKKWITASLTADELLSIHPCLVKHICLVANTTGASTALVYDGESTTGKLKLALSCITSTHFSDDFDTPVYFHRGIYVDVGANCTLFVIQYKEEVKC